MKTAYVFFWNEASREYSSKEYAYKTDIDFVIGDFAIVKVPVPSNNYCGFKERYQVVKVVRVEDGIAPKATKYIVGKVDVKEYEERIAREERKAELMLEMEKLAYSSSRLKTFEMLAESDPEMKAKLDEYKALN